MGDFNASANNGYLDYVKNFCNDENKCLLHARIA